MKLKKRLFAGFISLILLINLVPSANAAADALFTGSIGLTVRFGLPQAKAAVDSRGLTLALTSKGKKIILPLADGTPKQNDFNARCSVIAQNTDGVELTTERQLGSYQISLEGLPAGSTPYELTLEGKGYVPYSTSLTLDNYSKHVIIDTSSGSFSLGDVNSDGKVDREDLDEISGHLGKSDSLYDLNGDGKVCLLCFTRNIFINLRHI